VTMADRLGKAEDGECVLDLPMSRRDIGDSLGLTIETISRQFGELRDLGLLETSGRSQVRLTDLARLNAHAGHVSKAA
ncbi:MAG: helix-turn-helix domain-containing protein, partial [Pseudomonadota bacterium]